MKVIVLLALVAYGAAMQVCENDSDCAHLSLSGQLKCIKSYCKWGTCSCPHGKAVKFMGAHKQDRCVDMKRIGQKCTSDGAGGLCAAQNSYCNDDKKCECKDTYFSIMGGEYCVKSNALFKGDTCTVGGSLGSGPCTSGANFPYIPILYTKPVVMCTSGHMELGNQYTSHPTFPGAVFPQCRSKGKIGALCFTDAMCPSTRARCDKTKARCACTTAGEVPDINHARCGAALNFGDACTGIANSVCDGNKGLTCGDACALDLTAAKKCVCAPGYLTSGTSCQKRIGGSACFGDMNCKEWKSTAVCDAGKCVEPDLSGSSILTSGTSFFALSLAAIFFTNSFM